MGKRNESITVFKCLVSSIVLGLHYLGIKFHVTLDVIVITEGLDLWGTSSLAIMVLGLQAHQKSLRHDSTINMASTMASFNRIAAGCVGESTCSLENGTGFCSNTGNNLYPWPLMIQSTLV